MRGLRVALPLLAGLLAGCQLLDLDRQLHSAQRELLPMQPGDVAATAADVEDLAAAVDWRPGTAIEEGIGRFVAWYLDYTHETHRERI